MCKELGHHRFYSHSKKFDLSQKFWSKPQSLKSQQIQDVIDVAEVLESWQRRRYGW